MFNKRYYPKNTFCESDDVQAFLTKEKEQNTFCMAQSKSQDLAEVRNLEFTDLLKLRCLEEYSRDEHCLEYSVKDSYVLEENGKIIAAILAQKVNNVLEISSIFTDVSESGVSKLQKLVQHIKLNCKLDQVRSVVFHTNDPQTALEIQNFLAPLGHRCKIGKESHITLY